MKWLIAILMFISGYLPLHADEGMYPISEIRKLNLRAKGMQLDMEQIFSMDSIGLAHAIVMVGRCTGSFVSSEGLILTNHHCAFGAVQNASSVDHDYISDGFMARPAGKRSRRKVIRRVSWSRIGMCRRKCSVR